MNDSQLAKWLLDNGSPIIRRRIMREFYHTNDSDALLNQIMSDQTTGYWLDCLIFSNGNFPIHGSFDTCLENSLGKIYMMGLDVSVPELAVKTAPYLKWLKDNEPAEGDNVIAVFLRSITSAFLAMAGYKKDLAVLKLVRQRLQTVWEFCRRKDYDIFISTDNFTDLPKAYQNSSLLDPRLYENGDFALPWIYDLLAFSCLYDELDAAKIDDVLDYILSDQYQLIPEGYGTVQVGPNAYNAMGWSAHLPNYFDSNFTTADASRFIIRLLMMAKFPVVRKHRWFLRSMEYLQAFETANGTYEFPKNFLMEKRDSYFVNGAHMGLGEDRHHKAALEVESTFWMLKLKQVANLLEL